MSQPATVHVSGISTATTDKEIHDFFSFWYGERPYSPPTVQFQGMLTNQPGDSGKISSLKVTPESGESDSQKTASVTFEKEA